MRQLELYVRDHLAQRLTLRALKLLDVSVRHLARASADEGRERPSLGCRLPSEARRLLTETDLSMHEIAQRSAFHSPAAFSTAFRAASGFSPGEFRRCAGVRHAPPGRPQACPEVSNSNIAQPAD